MASPLMLTMDQVAPFVQQTLEQIRLGVYLARTEGGIFADLPDEIEITATIVTRPQALPIVSRSHTASKNREGGSTTEQQTGSENGSGNVQTQTTQNRTVKTVENGSGTTAQNVSDVSEQITTQGTNQSVNEETKTRWEDDGGNFIGSV